MRGLARLLRRNPTDAERILWQALTTDRRFAGQFKRQTPVGRHIPDFVSFVHRVAIELVNPDETEVIVKDRAARQAWLEQRGYRVVSMPVADVEGDVARRTRPARGQPAERPLGFRTVCAAARSGACEGMSHAHYIRDDTAPESKEAFEEIAGFFDKHLGK